MTSRISLMSYSLLALASCYFCGVENREVAERLLMDNCVINFQFSTVVNASTNILTNR